MIHSLRYLFAALLILSATLAGAQERTGVWRHIDDQGSLALRLNSDGTCLVSTAHNPSGRIERAECSYWVHGSRIRLRALGQRDGEGYNLLDIEYDPASSSLILHGDKPRVLTRDLAEPIAADEHSTRATIPSPTARIIAGELFPERCGYGGEKCFITYDDRRACPSEFVVLFPHTEGGQPDKPPMVWVTVDNKGAVKEVSATKKGTCRNTGA